MRTGRGIRRRTAVIRMKLRSWFAGLVIRLGGSICRSARGGESKSPMSAQISHGVEYYIVVCAEKWRRGYSSCVRGICELSPAGTAELSPGRESWVHHEI